MANGQNILADLLDELPALAGAHTVAGRNARQCGQDDLANIHVQQANLLFGIAMRLRTGLSMQLAVNHAQR